MNSSMSLRKPADKNSFKPVSPFEMFYQLTFMSAIAAAGLSRSKIFDIAALSSSKVAPYFVAINQLVNEFRYDYSEACRRTGVKAQSENMKSFLLRLSDALRSGEPLADFLAREAEVQGEDYKNQYERDLEALKQWSNAFSSIVISVSLIIIIQIISAMIYSMDVRVMSSMVLTGVMMSGMGAWIIWRSAPKETITMTAAHGSPEQKRAMRLFRLLLPIALMSGMVLMLLGIPTGYILILMAILILPVGIISIRSDHITTKRDVEFSTFLRSTGAMATASGTTLKQVLTKIDLSSFPTLEKDITRLSKRLEAQMDPTLCWHKFGQETGSRLIFDVVNIFFGAIKIGGDPERTGYLCSLFTARTTQLRAKRRLIAGTFSGLTTVMQAVVAGLMVFVFSIVNNFATLVTTLMPQNEEQLTEQSVNMSLGMAEFTAADLQFLSMITVLMVMLLALVSALAIVACDGGYRLKLALYLALTLFISGVSFLIVPPMVAGILKV